MTQLAVNVDAARATASAKFVSSPLETGAMETPPEFDAQEFLLTYRHLPLVLLRQQLHQRLSEYKSALVEVINEHYADFIRLATELRAVESAVVGRVEGGATHAVAAADDMADDMAESSSDRATAYVKDTAQNVLDITPVVQKLNQADERLALYCGRLEGALVERGELRGKKQLLQLLVKMNDAVCKVETLTASLEESSHAETKSSTAGTDGTRSARLKLIERIAIELHQLYFLLGKEQNVAFARTLQGRADRVSMTVEHGLAAMLRAALVAATEKTGDEDASTEAHLTQCFPIFSIMGKLRTAEEVFAEVLVRPRLEEIMTSQSVTTATDLRAMLERLRGLINTDLLTPWHASRTVAGMQLYAQGIANEILKRLLANSTLFSPAVPDQMQENHAACMAFADFLIANDEATEEERLATRNLPSFQELHRKWPLTAFFQLRFNELATALEAGLVTSVDVTSALQCLAQSSAALGFPSSTALVAALRTVWSDRVFIPPIAARCWRFTVQAVMRYVASIHQLWGELVKKDTAETAATPDPSIIPKAANHSPLECAILFTVELSRTQASVGDVVENDVVSRMMRLVDATDSDTGVTMQRVRKELDEALTTSWTPLRADLQPTIHRTIISTLSQPSLEMLRHVKDIPAQFRRTNKPPPTKSSFFVAQILKPLSAFVARWGDMLGEQDCRVIVEEVCAVVAAEYATTAEAVLVNLKNVEESLKWLQQQKKKRPEGVAGTDAVTMSDEDMARLQMHLDSEAFGRELRSIGANPDTMDSYRGLVKTTLFLGSSEVGSAAEAAVARVPV